MATIGIEVVDSGLIAVKDGLRLTPVIPAPATDRVWSDLAGSSQTRAGVDVSHSDVAHAILTELWRGIASNGDEASFAVPGTMRLPQIGVLIGLARHIGIPVAGVVDSAVAACAGIAARATVLHLDIQLYQAVLTELQGTSLLRRRRVESAPRAGLKSMYAAWAQLVAEAMVRRTRFDPLHQAATEQQVYERLPEWLAALSGREAVDAVVESGGSSFTATVRREQFTLAAEAWYAQLSELVRAGRKADEPATLALSARAALLPMLTDRLHALPGLDVIVLPETSAAGTAAVRAVDLGPAEPPTLVTALARSHAAAGGERRRAKNVAATHVILEGRAHAIAGEPLVVGFGEGAGRRIGLSGAAAGISRSHCTLLLERDRAIVRDHSRYGTFVNGERVDGEMELGAGDRLRVGTPGIVLELVKVG